MSTIPYEEPVLNEAVWNAWLAKMDRQEKAAQRMLGGTVLTALALAAVGFAIYRFAL